MPPRAQQAPLGWFGRIGLFTLFLLALLVFWAGFAMQSCSARGAVSDGQRARALVAAEPITVPADTVDRRNDGRLVHVTGLLGLTEPLVDPQTGITADALLLERQVEIYEWETDPSPSPSPSPSGGRRRHGRGASDYPIPPSRLAWSAQPLSVLSELEQGELGTLKRPNSARFKAYGKLRVGAFEIANMSLPRELTEAREALVLAPEVLKGLPEPLRGRARLSGGWIHVGDPAAPVAGDVRIRYLIAPASKEVTILAGQTYWGLSPHSTPGGESVAILKPGRHAARDLLHREAVAAEAGTGAGFVFSLPFFAMAAFLTYWPLRAAGGVLPGVRVVVEPGALAFILLGGLAASLGAGAYARWSLGAPGADWSAAVAVIALGTLVVMGVRRLERSDVVGLPPAFAAPAPLATGGPDDPVCWYHLDRGTVAGPFTLAHLADLAWTRLPGETMVWSPSTGGWVRATRVPALLDALTRRGGGRPPETTPSVGRALVDYYFLWPYHLVKETLGLGRSMRGDRPFGRSHYVGATVLAGMVALFFLAGALEVLDFESSPQEALLVRTVASLFALLGVVLPAVFMVRASACRLREMGQSERRRWLILVPGVNLLLWGQLLVPDGATDRQESRGWTPVLPPPDTERRSRP